MTIKQQQVKLNNIECLAKFLSRSGSNNCQARKFCNNVVSCLSTCHSHGTETNTSPAPQSPASDSKSKGDGDEGFGPVVAAL